MLQWFPRTRAVELRPRTPVHGIEVIFDINGPLAISVRLQRSAIPHFTSKESSFSAYLSQSI